MVSDLGRNLEGFCEEGVLTWEEMEEQSWQESIPHRSLHGRESLDALAHRLPALPRNEHVAVHVSPATGLAELTPSINPGLLPSLAMSMGGVIGPRAFFW